MQSSHWIQILDLMISSQGLDHCATSASLHPNIIKIETERKNISCIHNLPRVKKLYNQCSE
jgi:hypothetical protein